MVITNQTRKNDEDVIETSHVKTTNPVAKLALGELSPNGPISKLTREVHIR
jgi:hypothetical protein